MALKTAGTNATTSLSAVQFNPSADKMTSSDLALFNALVQPNYGGAHPNSGKLGTYISRDGQLFVPMRGFIRLVAGDWLCVDSTTGWPFVLSNAAITSGPWTHT
jgi:hypothetical protein